MNLIKNILLLVLVSLSCLIGNAQDLPEDSQSPNIRMIGRYSKGKIDLRWFPTTAAKWRLANKNGYTLERLELTDKADKDNWVKLNSSSLKPLSMERWRAEKDMSNKYIEATARAIHESMEPPRESDNMDRWLDYHNQETGVFGFVILSTNISSEAAKGAGLSFVDNNIKKGRAYAYRITINETRNPSDLDTALVLIENTVDVYEAPSVLGVRLEEHEKTIKLFWEAENNDRLFGLYHVERSLENQNFERITNLPIYLGAKDASEHVFIDSVENYTGYFYRVVGITPFGDEGKPSEVIQGMARDFSPAMGATGIKAEGDRDAVVVNWNLEFESPDLAGFHIGRGNSADGPFNYLTKDLLPSSTRTYRDSNPTAREPFYVVHAIDTAGNVSPAFAAMASVFDDQAPVSPTGLTGQVDTNGIVTIQWEQNREADLMGYHIFTANGKNDVYHPLTKRPLRSNSFQDTVTMKALDKQIFYKITALDFNNNPSEYSEVLVLKRPDIIPPAAPSIYSYEVGERSVKLEWHNSASDDIAQHILTRKKEGERESVKISNYRGKERTSFIDKDLEMGASYKYTLTAVDEAGNETLSELYVSIYDDGKRPAIDRLNIEFDENTKTANLNWNYDRPTGDFRFVIFKGKGEAPLNSYRSTKASQPAYQDLVKEKGLYRYAVKVIYADGGESPLSQVVELNVGK